MIAIVSAMSIEIDHLLSYALNYTKRSFNNVVFYEAKINCKDVLIIKTGVGKVNATLGLTKALENYDIDLVINLGVCGAVKPLASEDIIIADKFYCYDFDISTIDDVKVGEMPDAPFYYEASLEVVNKVKEIALKKSINYMVTPMITGDQFVVEYKQIEKFIENINPPYGIDMESFAFAHVSSFYNKKFIAIKGVSDSIASDTQITDYQTILVKICTTIDEIVKNIIDSLE